MNGQFICADTAAMLIPFPRSLPTPDGNPAYTIRGSHRAEKRSTYWSCRIFLVISVFPNCPWQVTDFVFPSVGCMMFDVHR